MTSPVRRLLIVSHVRHYRHEGRLYAYAAYVREIDRWAELFPEVTLASPCYDGPPTGDCQAFERRNITIIPQPETGGVTWWAKIYQALLVPYLLARLLPPMLRADAIHVRGPANLGLLGTLLAPLCSRRLVAKYAGNWAGYPEEPWTLRLQRALLRSRWWRGPVTVYGDWPNQPSHVVSFFTSVMTRAQVARARAVAAARRPRPVTRVLYVGRLAPNKNVDVLLEAIAAVRRDGHALECAIVGDGTERAALEDQARKLGLDDTVRFVGAVGFDQVLEWYEWGDVLVLASDAEGWPKAIAEAMAFGLVCIASDRGFISYMLAEGRGILLTPRRLDQLTDALTRVAAAPADFADMRTRASAWAQRRSLEDLRDALAALLTERWGVPISVSAAEETAPLRPALVGGET